MTVNGPGHRKPEFLIILVAGEIPSRRGKVLRRWTTASHGPEDRLLPEHHLVTDTLALFPSALIMINPVSLPLIVVLTSLIMMNDQLCPPIACRCPPYYVLTDCVLGQDGDVDGRIRLDIEPGRGGEGGQASDTTIVEDTYRYVYVVTCLFLLAGLMDRRGSK